jgi:hypothetical protein
MDMGMGMDMDKAIFLLFRFVSDGLWCFGYIETPKQAVSILKRTTDTNVLLQIVPKLVADLVSFIWKRY